MVTDKNKDRIRIGFFFDGGEGGGVVEYMRLLLENIDREQFYSIGIFLGEGNSYNELQHLFDSKKILTGGRLVNYKNASGKVGKVKQNLQKAFIATKGLLSLVRFIKKERIQVMDVSYFPHHLLVGMASKMAGCGCVWHWHGASRATGMKLKMLKTGVARFCDVIIPISDFVKNNLPAETASKVKMIYNGVNTAKIADGQQKGYLRSLLQINDTTKLITITGTISPIKGHQYFIEAADAVLEKYPDVRFAIIGRESEAQRIRVGYEEKMRTLVQSLNREKEIIFLGQIPEVSRYTGDCDIMCMPTTPYKNTLGEGFGLSLVESMAAGVPVIATTAGAFPEIVEDQRTGILVPPGDSKALSAAILDLLNDANKRQQIAVEGQKSARERFDISVMMRELESVYKRLN